MIGQNDNGARNDLDFKADLTLQRIAPRLDAVWEAGGVEEGPRHEFDSAVGRALAPPV